MVIPRLRWPLLAAATLLLVPARPASLDAVRRTGLIADSTFELPDSVRAILSQVSRLVVAPDSSLYLADRLVPAILHLEPSGQFRRVIGRQGSGPGEFAQVFSIGLIRDSLWAMDVRQVRVTLFPPQGTGVHTMPFGVRLSGTPGPGNYSVRGAPTSMLPDGALLLEEDSPDPRRPTHGLLLRADRTMRVLDTIAQLAAEHSAMTFEWEGGGYMTAQPFGDSPTYGVAADGSLLVLVNRRAATSSADAQFIVVGLRNGKEQVFNRTIDYQPRPLTRAAIDSQVRRIARGRSGDASWPITPDSVRRKLFKPAYYPPVADVRVGRDGTVWLKVQFADSPTDADEYLQLSPRGLPIRRVTTPKGFKLLEADRRTVWGSFNDSMDVPVVQRYALDQVALN
jgi:hypothetical protein